MLSFNEYRELVNSGLTDLIREDAPESSVLREAMRYSLKVGGKRLRPVLLLADVTSPAEISKRLFLMHFR